MSRPLGTRKDCELYLTIALGLSDAVITPKSGDLDGDGKPELLTYIFDKQKKIEGIVIVRFKDGLPSMKNFVFPTANIWLDNITLSDWIMTAKRKLLKLAFGTLKIYKWDGNKAVLTSKYP